MIIIINWLLLLLLLPFIFTNQIAIFVLWSYTLKVSLSIKKTKIRHARINGPVRVLFETRLIFPGIDGPIVSPPLWSFMFFFLQHLSLLFSVTHSSSFSVIHVSVNIKNNVEKDETKLLFFLSKSPGGHSISFQIKPRVAFRLPYLLIDLFFIGSPVLRTDSRAFRRSGGRVVGRCTVTWLPNFLGWVI